MEPLAVIQARSAFHTPFVIKRLEIVEFDQDGKNRKTHVTHDPTWKQIETAIRRLNRDNIPIVRLRLREDITNKGYLSIVGGNGIYAMEGRALGDVVAYHYYDKKKKAKEIAIRVGDEDYFSEERSFCHDIAVVLKAAEYFARLGHIDPDIPWESSDPPPVPADTEDPWLK